MSHPVIPKTDIGKVKTSKNVMKLQKLLLTVIVKHPVHTKKLNASTRQNSKKTGMQKEKEIHLNLTRALQSSPTRRCLGTRHALHTMPRPCRDQGGAKQSNTTFIHRTLAAKKLSWNICRRQPNDLKQTTVSELLCIDCKTIQNNVRPPNIDCKVRDKTWVRSRGWDGVSVGWWVKRENDEEDWRRVSLEASPDVSCFSLAPSTSPQMIELHRISTISLNVRMVSFMFNAIQLKHGIGRGLTI